MQFQLTALVLLASTVLAVPVSQVAPSTTSVSSVVAPSETASTTVLHGSMFGPAEFKVRKTSTLVASQATQAL